MNRVFVSACWLAAIWFASAGTAAVAGQEINGVIATQPVAPGDMMNPPFSATVDINVHAPTTLNANTGLMVVVHGLGGDYHQYDTECAFWVNDLNVYTVQVNYRGTGASIPGTLVDFGKYQAIDVLRAVQYMLANYAINKSRVLLWGVSGGGIVALNAAKMAPDVFAMVAALSPITRPTNELDRTGAFYEADPTGGWEAHILGTGKTYTVEEWDIRDAQFSAAFLTLPVYLVHGTADPVVDIQHSHDLKAALTLASGTVTLTTIVKGRHAFEGATDPTENTRFKVTQKYLRNALLTSASSGLSVMDLQGKRVFPTRGTKAWPVKFDHDGLATLTAIDSPGVVTNLWLPTKTVKRGLTLNFNYAFNNWTTSPAFTTLIAGFVDLQNATVVPIIGPAPLVVPMTGIQGSLGLPIQLPVGDYLLASVVLGSTPSPYIDLDYVRFSVVP